MRTNCISMRPYNWTNHRTMKKDINRPLLTICMHISVSYYITGSNTSISGLIFIFVSQEAMV